METKLPEQYLAIEPGHAFQYFGQANEPPVENGLSVSRDDGTAIVRIQGGLTNGLSQFDSGVLVELDQLTDQVRRLTNDDSTKRVLFYLDSPGGTVAGLMEAADAISKLSQKKPTTAYSQNMQASGAYLLASQCRQNIVAPLCLSGSVGVYAVRVDASQIFAQSMLKFHVSRSGEKKGLGLAFEAVTQVEATEAQARVDAMAGTLFDQIATHRRSRNLNAEVLESYQGALFVGSEAVKRRLADRVGLLDDAMEVLQKMPITKSKDEILADEYRAQPVDRVMQKFDALCEEQDAMSCHQRGISQEEAMAEKYPCFAKLYEFKTAKH